MAVGLAAGAVWLDIDMPDDVRPDRPTILGVVRMLSEQRWEFGVALASAVLGAQCRRVGERSADDA